MNNYWYVELPQVDGTLAITGTPCVIEVNFDQNNENRVVKPTRLAGTAISTWTLIGFHRVKGPAREMTDQEYVAFLTAVGAPLFARERATARLNRAS